MELALDLLDADGLPVVSRSKWYRTPAVPQGSGEDFVNGAVSIASELEPAEFLARLHAIERRLGRERETRWGPRTCDLDLLACGDLVAPDRGTLREWMDLPPARASAVPGGLMLPHPRMHERAFVLRALADIAPDWVHPILGRSVETMLQCLPARDRAGIEPL